MNTHSDSLAAASKNEQIKAFQHQQQYQQYQHYFTNAYLIGWCGLWWMLIQSVGSTLELVACALVLLTALCYLFVNQCSRSALASLFTALACGIIIDGLFLQAQIITYHSVLNIHLLPPLWILSLWALLGMGIHSYPRIFVKNKWLTAGICLLSAPLCYWTGSRSQAITLSDNNAQMLASLALIGCAYGVAGVILFLCNKTQAPAKPQHKMHASKQED